MSVNSVGAAQTNGIYDSYGKKTEEKKSQEMVENTAQKDSATSGTPAAVYEKSEESGKKATYSINKMSAEDRAALVKQLKADHETRKQNLVNLVSRMMGKQADAATRAQAQKDISEDGYWGVKQTSQRLFDFASALAGDDVEKMKEMQAAMEKGFKKAAKSWGGELPGICKETIAAANKLFEDYYHSKDEEGK